MIPQMDLQPGQVMLFVKLCQTVRTEMAYCLAVVNYYFRYQYRILTVELWSQN